MNDAAALIAELDRDLAENGELVKLRRSALGPNNKAVFPVDVDTMAMIRGYRPYEVAAGSGITQQDVSFIISPTNIEARNWPGTAASEPLTDKRVPVKGDVLITSRGPLTVQSAAGLYVDNTLVRIEGSARGRQV
jgi:hypothetical protein